MAPESLLAANEPDRKKPKLITEFFAAASNKPTKKQHQPVKKSSQLQNNPIETTTETKVKESTTVQKDVLEVNDEKEQSSVKESEKVLKKESVVIDQEQTNQALYPQKTDYEDFCKKYGFDKKKWIESLSTEERLLLALEINTLHITWLAFLHKELTKPYFINLKKFLRSQMTSKTVFPPPGHIYSWSHLTPLPDVKCLILGQDPYHNFNQAHGLAFLVLEPTRPPPSLLNIYKTLKIDFPNFQVPDYNSLSKQGRPGGGNLTKWAKRGVLMLNACLTVEAHKANSHANKGWESFTEEVIRVAINFASKERETGFVIMAWGSPAQKRVACFNKQLSTKTPFLVLKTVHPSPLSASRGFFDLQVFKKCNQWLKDNGAPPIDWGIVEGNSVTE